MTTLQNQLYEYIEDKRFPALQSNGEFLLARKQREEAEEKLTANLTEEQTQLFLNYTDADNLLDSVLLRYVFQETLTILHDILHISL